jgi:putative SOS response-associated peptidase YedK
VCNLYSLTKSQDAIRRITGAMRDTTGNLPPLPGIFLDYEAPIIRTGENGVRELVKARWGMPSPTFALKGKKVDKGVTNIRNVASPHWRRWLGLPSRCLVPFTSFSENDKLPDGRFEPVWFAFDKDRPLAFFAGIWTRWTSTRKLAEGEVTADLFGFLTMEANCEVGTVHPKAMPVILTREEELESWLAASWPEAARLQRPLPDGSLQVVARGERKDELAAVEATP